MNIKHAVFIGLSAIGFCMVGYGHAGLYNGIAGAIGGGVYAYMVLCWS